MHKLVHKQSGNGEKKGERWSRKTVIVSDDDFPIAVAELIIQEQRNCDSATGMLHDLLRAFNHIAVESWKGNVDVCDRMQPKTPVVILRRMADFIEKHGLRETEFNFMSDNDDDEAAVTSE